MRLVLLVFPQDTAVRESPHWVSPVRDILRYTGVTCRHLNSRGAALRRVAGGIAHVTAFTGALWFIAVRPACGGRPYGQYLKPALNETASR
jgi:hypothetical protein